MWQCFWGWTRLEAARTEKDRSCWGGGWVKELGMSQLFFCQPIYSLISQHLLFSRIPIKGSGWLHQSGARRPGWVTNRPEHFPLQNICWTTESSFTVGEEAGWLAGPGYWVYTDTHGNMCMDWAIYHNYINNVVIGDYSWNQKLTYTI